MSSSAFSSTTRQPIGPRAGEHVEHGAVRGGEGRHLGVEAPVIQVFVDRVYIAYHQRFQPAFGMESPKSLVPRDVRTACGPVLPQISTCDGRVCPQTLHHQTQDAITDLGIQYSPDAVPLRRP